MFDPNKTISVFCDDYDNLEAHHIIPLGSVASVGESTSALRNNNKHICNSPLNFVYITKKDNDEISADPIDVYSKKLCVEAKSQLNISTYNEQIVSDEQIKTILSSRYDSLQGAIKVEVKSLIDRFNT